MLQRQTCRYVHLEFGLHMQIHLNKILGNKLSSELMFLVKLSRYSEKKKNAKVDSKRVHTFKFDQGFKHHVVAYFSLNF